MWSAVSDQPDFEVARPVPEPVEPEARSVNLITTN